MKVCKVTRFCRMLVLLAGLAGSGIALAADGTTAPGTDKDEQNEMPVLTGEGWRIMQPDAKIAFIWGIGHVVTIEEYVKKRHPELQRKGFQSKLAEGLRGVPMSTIVQEVDGYYQRNPDDLDLPVMRVVWRQIVKPKLKTGIADRPLVKED